MKRDEVDKLAKFARMQIGDSEKDKLAKDLSSILAYVSELQEVVADLPETPEPGELRNVMREDDEPHIKNAYSDDLLREMPAKDGRYLKVKKIL
jgi:aspartyl/glutamyl-tRNA(Asn/Gln) amidotransferase C subunit